MSLGWRLVGPEAAHSFVDQTDLEFEILLPWVA